MKTLRSAILAALLSLPAAQAQITVSPSSGQTAAQVQALIDASVVVYNVKTRGAIGDGVTDDSAIFQTVFDLAKVTGGVIFIPRAAYYLATSINGTTGLDNGGAGDKPKYVIVGESGPGYTDWLPSQKPEIGVRIIGGDTGYPTFDFSGALSVEIYNITFDTKAATRPSTSVLVGRTADISGGGSRSYFNNIVTYGDYSIAGVTLLSAELVTAERCSFYTGPSAGQSGFYASKLPATIYGTIASRYQTFNLTTSGGQSQLTMEKCSFVNYYDTDNYAAVFEYLGNAHLNQVYTSSFYSDNVLQFRKGAFGVSLTNIQMEFVAANFPGSSPLHGIYFGSADTFSNIHITGEVNNIYGADGATLDQASFSNILAHIDASTNLIDVDVLTNSRIDTAAATKVNVRSTGTANIFMGQTSGNVTGAAQASSVYTKSDGSVYIGPTTQAAPLTVGGSVGFLGVFESTRTGSGMTSLGLYSTVNGYRGRIGFDPTDANFLIDGYGNNLILNLPGGNVIVGSTTDNGAKLQVAGTATVAGASTLTGGIVGVITVSDATAGNVGEYISASVVVGSATALTTATPKTVTSISLTAGDWDVTAIGALTGASTGTAFDVAIGTTTNSFTGTVLGDTRCETPTVSLTGADASLMIPSVRINVSATTTYYLVVQEVFTIGSPAAYGRISARRCR